MSSSSSARRRRTSTSFSSFFLRSTTSLIALVVLVASGGTHAQNTGAPSASSAGVSGLSSVLSPSYVGMGIEPSHLFAFTGTTSPNAFSMQLLNNLANYTGQPPHIRLGGNTMDNAIFNSSYSGYYFQPNPDTTGVTDQQYFGPNYYKVLNYFPKGTPITYGLLLAYDGPQNRTQMNVEIAQGVVDSLTNVWLYSLEIGNEPDLYVQNQYRPQGWGVTNFGSEWIQDVLAVYEQVLKPKNMPKAFFEGACTATTAANRGFRIEDLVKTGIAQENGVYLSGWNQHDYYYYVNVSGYQLTLNGLMDLSSTYSQFSEWTEQTAQAEVTGKPYYLREMGSIGPGGIQGISDTFGNALWTINFFLYAATVGVDSVQLHMLFNSYGSPWIPVTDDQGNPPHVRPSYYAWAAMAQINGAGCQTQIAPITLSNTPSMYNNRLAAYAVYDNGSLQSIAVVNSRLAYASSGSGISSQQFTLSLPSLAGQTFYLSLLTAGGADSTTGTTWNGISYEQSSNGSPTTVDKQVRTVKVGSDGTLTFSVRDSQAVVANLGSALGSTNNVVDKKACAQFSQSGYADTKDNGFKATSGFASHLPISLGAIIGIAAGGGVALLAILGLCIWCCVRRRRRHRQMIGGVGAGGRKGGMGDKTNLLPPSYQNSTASNIGKRGMPYNSVPINELADSSDDIFMMPVRGKGMRDSNSSFRGHKHQDSYGSAANSMSNSPLMPSSPALQSRVRVDSNNSYDAPVPPNAPYGMATQHNGSPKNTSRFRAGQQGPPAPGGGAAIGLSNLNPNQGGRSGQLAPPSAHSHSGHGAAAAGAALAAGAVAGAAAGHNRRSGGGGGGGNAAQSNAYGQSDPWQQFADQRQRPSGYEAQQIGSDSRARYGSSPAPPPRRDFAAMAAGGAGAGALAFSDPMDANRQRRERRRSLPSEQRDPQQQRGGMRPSGAASSQGHGNKHGASASLSHDFSSRPPVPPLPHSLKSGGNAQQQQQESNKAAIAAAIAAASQGNGSTSAAQNAYFEQRQQQQYMQYQQQYLDANQLSRHGGGQMPDGAQQSRHRTSAHAPAFANALNNGRRSFQESAQRGPSSRMSQPVPPSSNNPFAYSSDGEVHRGGGGIPASHSVPGHRATSGNNPMGPRPPPRSPMREKANPRYHDASDRL